MHSSKRSNAKRLALPSFFLLPLMASSLLPPLLLLAFAAVTTVTSTTHPADLRALEDVRRSVDQASIPPASCLASWDFSRDPCDSAFGLLFTCGIRCDAASADGLRRVTELALDAAGYSGRLSPSLWSLQFLESLELADNRFAGSIPSPPTPGGLPPRLHRISLSRNALSGGIPTSLSRAPALQELALDGNHLSGAIPASISGLTSLRRLELQSNNLTGEIPDLSPLQKLYFLDASENAISGGFPSAGRLPPSLVELSLRDNRLWGILPGDAIAALPAVEVLDLAGNGLWGVVPGAAFAHPALEQLGLARNQFGWIEPPADGGLSSQLVAVDLGRNRLGGFLPLFFGLMPRLSAITLEYNRFTGMIPAQYAVRAAGIGGGVPFGRLILAGNYLFGPIPSPMEGIREGSAVVRLQDNCLLQCPAVFFFCGGGQQKAQSTCRQFNPMIP